MSLLRLATDRSVSHPPLAVGDLAPDFCLEDSRGDLVTLSGFRGRKNVTLFFYPKDYSPICTLEMIAFRASYQKFLDTGAEVCGVSQDPPASHASVCASLHLPFRLLTDCQHTVREKYGGHGALGGWGDRMTFLIDRQGVIRCIYAAAFRPNAHARAALEIARTLG